MYPNVLNTNLLYLFEFLTKMIKHISFSHMSHTDLKTWFMNPLYTYKCLKVSRCHGNLTAECFTSAKYFTSKDLHKISVIPDKI